MFLDLIFKPTFIQEETNMRTRKQTATVIAAVFIALSISLISPPISYAERFIVEELPIPVSDMMPVNILDFNDQGQIVYMAGMSGI